MSSFFWFFFLWRAFFLGRKPVFHLIILCSFLLGCAASQSFFWRDWSAWSDWKAANRSESRSVSVASEPSGCEVFVNGSFQGVTPLTVRLSFPVLESERFREQVVYTKTNASPEWLLFSKGDRPGTSRVVDRERETRTCLKDVGHEVVVKKAGFRSARKLVGQEGGSCEFILARKPCVYLDVSVVDESRLTVAQNMYDTVFGKKYSKTVASQDVQGFFQSSRELGDAFDISESRAGCEVLSCSLVIRNDFSSLEVKIVDGNGKASFKDSQKFRTGVEREEFLSGLKREVGRACQEIYRKFCGE